MVSASSIDSYTATNLSCCYRVSLGVREALLPPCFALFVMVSLSLSICSRDEADLFIMLYSVPEMDPWAIRVRYCLISRSQKLTLPLSIADLT